METNRTETEFLVTVDHGYEGEKQRYFASKPEAEAFAAEAAQDPYVMRTSIDEMTWIVEDGVRRLA